MIFKPFLLILCLVITIQCIKSKKVIRSFLVIEDTQELAKILFQFTVFNSSGKKKLHKLKATTNDIETVTLVDLSTKNIIANAQGEWMDNMVNMTISIYDTKYNRWIAGTIRDISESPTESYRIEWNQKI